MRWRPVGTAGGIADRCSTPNIRAINPPTSRQLQVLDFIRQHLDEGSPVPTVREISRQLGLKSTSPAQLHLNALRRKGYLEDSEGHAQSLRLTGDSGTRLQVRSWHLIACFMAPAPPAGESAEAGIRG